MSGEGLRKGVDGGPKLGAKVIGTKKRNSIKGKGKKKKKKVQSEKKIKADIFI